jgi:hypothetical protein
MFHGDVFSKADKLLLEYLIALGFTEEEAVEKLPHAKDAVRQAAPIKESAALSDDFSEAAARPHAAEPLSLPDTAPLLYNDRQPGMGLVEFLETVWMPYIRAGLLTRPRLRQLDLALENAITNYQRKQQLPAHVRVPTKHEAKSQEMIGYSAEEWAQGKVPPNLYAVGYHRALRRERS